MASNKPKDPFTFFKAADGLCDSDFSESEEESDSGSKESKNVQEKPSFISKPSENSENVSSKLPSPKFESVTKPGFKANEKLDVDWDKVVKNVIPEVDDGLDRTNTHCMPPPKTYDPQTANLKPTIGDPVVTGSQTPIKRGGVFWSLYRWIFCPFCW